MQRVHRMLLIALVFSAVDVVLAQQPVPAGAAPSRRGTVSTQPFRPVATIKDLMAVIIDPASDIVFDAVSTEVTTTGSVEKSPKNDEEWATVRSNALLMIEGGNMLLIPGRHVMAGSSARPSTGQPASRGPQIELDPYQVEARIAKSRPAFVKLAQGFIVAASAALRAAEAQDPQALLASGALIDTACENCHLRYWYPDQVKLLDAADRKLRQAKPKP